MSLVCLFDVDGTLVDSREPILTALNAALADHGQTPIAGDRLWRHIGPPLHDSLTELLSERGTDLVLVEPVIESFRGHYTATSVEMARSYDGIPELLRRIYPQARLSVVTSKPVQFAGPILETLGFARYMERIEGPSLEEKEPKTETLARALLLLDHAKSQACFVMIGDRHHDIEAARINGIESIGVTWGFGSVEELVEAGADHLAANPEELAGLLEVYARR